MIITPFSTCINKQGECLAKTQVLQMNNYTNFLKCSSQGKYDI